MNDLKVDERRFRPELEGIRAVAAFLVAVYHIWLGRVSGGVDVFFVVSGYLITMSLLNRMFVRDAFSYREYLVGLARRLFPLAYTVIGVVIVVSIILLPLPLWPETIREALASIFYFENWQLSWKAVDYLAQNNEASPFQHFWALSLQGQFYITWPIVIGIVYVLTKRVSNLPPRKTLLALFIFLFSTSLIYSIIATETNQAVAYFNTFARVWEFSLGGILALLLPYFNPSKLMSFIIGWVGLMMIVLTGIVLPVSTVFPGYAALFPLTGVILVIISAEQRTSFGAERLLSTKPFQFFGSISYGFYLWHWPLLIFYFNWTELEEVPFTHGLLLLIAAFLLSLLSKRWIEEPIQQLSVQKHRKQLTRKLILFTTSVLLLTGGWAGYVQVKKYDSNSLTYEDLVSGENDKFKKEVDYPGARVLYEQVRAKRGLPAVPELLEIKEDLPIFYSDSNCYSHASESPILKSCDYGELDDYDLTLALVGGSHSGHWFPALEPFMKKHKIKLTVLNKDQCRYSATAVGDNVNESCIEWANLLRTHLSEAAYDIVFTTANVGKEGHIPEGYLEAWKELEGKSEIFAMRDNPRLPSDTPVCLGRHEEDPKHCGNPREKVLSHHAPWETLETLPSNVTFVDFSDYFCVGDFCPPIIGNIITFRDAHHISTAYAETLATPLEKAMMPLIQKLKK